MTYPGGKNGSGSYQAIINQMPPHQVYVEAFLGSGAILHAKRPAGVASIGIDIDAHVLNSFNHSAIPNLTLLAADAIAWLLLDNTYTRQPETLIYLDPPYLLSTRSCQRQIYRYELTRDDHVTLLHVLKSLPCMVILSGYHSSLYADELQGWRTVQFQAQRRNGQPGTEWLWMNYPEPFELHDYRYLGENYRERERIKRKKNRWIARLERTTSTERYALLAAIEQYRTQSAGSTATAADTTIPGAGGHPRQFERWAPAPIAEIGDHRCAPAVPSFLPLLPGSKEIENP